MGGPELFGELLLPGLEDLERADPVAGECPGLDLGPDRLLAQLVQSQHPIEIGRAHV